MAFGRAKVILFGEHGVVHGRAALAAALDRGAEASAEPWPTARLEVAPWGVAFDADQVQAEPRAELLRTAFCALLDGYGAPRPALRLRVSVSVPGGSGLGSSAALSVAIVRAIDEARGVARTPAEVAEASLAAERVFHGNPSGVDNAMAAGSGVALFRRGKPLEPVKLARSIWLVIGDSGEPGDTKHTVESVRQQYERDPQRVGEIFDGMEALVINARSALQIGELSRLGQLMTLNQKLLNTLMLSTPRLEEMCRVAETSGALGAKLTGGGGGGCMIALCAGKELAEPVLNGLSGLGRKAVLVEVQP